MNLLSNIKRTLSDITGKNYSFPQSGVLCDSEAIIEVKDITEEMMTGRISFDDAIIKMMARFDEAHNPNSPKTFVEAA